MSRAFRIIFSVCLCIPLTGASPALATGTPRQLTFCVEDRDVRPWITHDGKGLNLELLNRVAARLGVYFNYRQIAWKRCLEELKNNTVDGAVGASFKAERLEYGVYPGGEQADPRKRLNMDRYMLVQYKGAGLAWDGETLTGLHGPVGVQLGYSAADVLRSKGVAVDDGSPGAAELMRKLYARRILAASLLEGELRSVMTENPHYGAVLEILTLPLVEKPYYLLLSHQLVESWPGLAADIWQGIEQVRESRDYQMLERQRQ
jgi:polar amino acid transport system substrate-binding protein